MGFVPGYTNDIFISYSHIDNDPLIEGKLGWVDFFEDLLLKRMRVRLGAGVEIFRDPQLRRYGQFSDQLKEKISNSATFICILSPRYVASEWCSHELSQFCALAGSDRIIKVTKTALDDNSFRPEIKPLLAAIKDVLDTSFYIEERSGFFKDLQPEIIHEDIAACVSKIDIIAQNLVELLKRLRDAQAAAVANEPARPEGERSPATVEPNQVAVYLAETTQDLSVERERVKTELLQFNCRILPDQILPQDRDTLITVVENYMKQAKLSVHLIGARYGVRPEMEERSVPHIQYDVAAELSRAGKLIQLAWMPEGLTPAEETQRLFVEHIKDKSPDFLRTKLEDLKTEIRKKLNPDSDDDGWDDVVDGDPINVCLFCHEQDMESVGPIYNHMLFNELFKVKLPLKDAESFQRHKQLLQASDAFLLYYGTADEDWFVNIWRLIQRHFSAGRTKPVLAKGIYAGKPSTTEKNLLESEDLVIMKNYEKFTPNSLNPFIKKIRAAKGAVS